MSDTPTTRDSDRQEYLMPTLTVRQFIAAIGVAMVIGAALALLLPLQADYAGMFGRERVECGSALQPSIMAIADGPIGECRDALSTRRAWAWPLGIVGVAVVAGALLVDLGRLGTRTRETGPSERDDSEGPVVQ